jgi:hypothetical protein
LGFFLNFNLIFKDVLVLKEIYIFADSLTEHFFKKNSWAFPKIECQSQSPREWAFTTLGPTLGSALWGPHYPTKTKPQILKFFEHFK